MKTQLHFRRKFSVCLTALFLLFTGKKMKLPKYTKSISVNVLIFFTAFLLIPNMSYAHTCRTPSQDTAYKNAFSVFSGEIVDGMGTTSCGPKKMLFKVIDVYKGKLPPMVYVFSGDACISSGIYLTKGVKYLLYTSKNKSIYKNNDSLSVWACSYTKPLSRVKEDEFAFLKEKKEQINALTIAIELSPKNKESFLKSKIEHFLYWHDYENAEKILKQVLDEKADDLWIRSKLIEVLYKLKKPQEVIDTYRGYAKGQARSHEDLRHVNLSKLALSKPLGKRGYIILEDNWLKDINIPSQTLYIRTSKNSQFTNLNLSGGKLSGNYIDGLRVYSSNMEGTDFSGLVAKKLSFSNTNLVKANFSNSKISNLGLGGSNVTDANFINSKLNEPYLMNQDLKNANFTDAKILNGRLQNANFQDAILDGVSLVNSEYSCETKWPNEFDPEAAGAFKKHACKNNITIDEDSSQYRKALASLELVGKDFRENEFKKRHDFKGKNLENADFSDAYLRGAHFNYANLTGTKFIWADAGANYYFTTIKNTNFNNSNLRRATFFGTEIINASFESAQMQSTTFKNVMVLNGTFKHADLSNANFENSSFEKSDFSHVQMIGARLNKADFSGTIFSNVLFEGVRAGRGQGGGPWNRSKFINANFKSSSLNKSDFRGIDFSNADFKDTSLFLTRYNCETKWPDGFQAGVYGAILEDLECVPSSYFSPKLQNLDLSREVLSKVNFKDVSFKNTNLRATDLRGSDFSDAYLEEADLTGAFFDCETKWPFKYDPIKAGAYLSVGVLDEECWKSYGPANLEGKDMREMNLFYAPFAKANLKNTNFSNASLGRADLFKANLSGANLNGADLSSANLRQAKLKNASYDCNTLWPDNFILNEHGLIESEGVCKKTTKRTMAGVRAILNDWRKPNNTGAIEINGERLAWFNGRSFPMKQVTFENVFMRKAIFERVSIESSEFLNSNLRDSNFKNSKLNNVDFSGSDISGANFEGATFEDVVWKDVIYDCNTKGLPLWMRTFKQCK